MEVETIIFILLMLCFCVFTCQSATVKAFLAGSFSGTCSTVLFQPLDLIKTRIQLLRSAQHQTKSIVSVAYSVIRTDTLSGLWKGLVPSLYRTVPGIGIYFCTLHQITHHFQSRSPPLAHESLLMGVCARSVADVVTLPFTVMKTRYEVVESMKSSGYFRYQSMLQALMKTYRLEGFQGLYSGLWATLLRDVPFSGLYFMFYTQAKNVVSSYNLAERTTHPLVLFPCGLTAGCLAAVVTHPADVIKTRLQLKQARRGAMTTTVYHILQEHGMRGFLHGLAPRLLRRALMAAMSWTVFEQVMDYLGLKM